MHTGGKGYYKFCTMAWRNNSCKRANNTLAFRMPASSHLCSYICVLIIRTEIIFKFLISQKALQKFSSKTILTDVLFSLFSLSRSKSDFCENASVILRNKEKTNEINLHKWRRRVPRTRWGLYFVRQKRGRKRKWFIFREEVL